MMSDIQSVIIRLRNPTGRPGDYGTVEYAYFKVNKDGVLILTDREGHVIRKVSGEVYDQVLSPDDNPKVIAARVYKVMRRELHGESDFYKPINYPVRAIV
jgi:hypothetical protein